ncbi:type II toxin-antitoxin system Phd/YefM family antitoxin [Candidatus Peregrinibacteria bacterium]|nr:type II toxin-antitoxin system Phd/YefM family antitoxin [Candidatus Peregrinibacteria bacterium]
MKKIYSATEARKQFFKLIRIAAKPGSSVTITLEGQPPVIVMSQDEFEGWQETLEILSDPQAMQQIRESEHETEFVEWEDVKKSLSV